MKKVIRRWLSLLVVCILVMNFSISAFAEESDDPTNDDNNEATTESSIDWSDESQGYSIEFIDSVENLVYTGEEHRPEIQVIHTETAGNEGGGETEIVDANNYYVKYSGNVSVGTATVQVTPTEESGYTGSLTAEFEIQPADISDAEVSLSTEKSTYTGKERKPSVSVVLGNAALVKGTDYEVTYSDNVKIGTATVTVKGIGNYTGEAKAQYKIVLGTPSLSTSTSYNKVTLTWKKITGATGYQIQRSTSKDSGYKTIKKITSGSTVKYVDEDVKFNGTYYYRIRAYRTVDGVTKYSDYSSVNTRTVRPAKATIDTISRVSYNSLKVTWKKVAGASGYAVYRSTSENGEYTRVGKVKGGSTLSYTDEGLTCGRTYYYKVRAYRTVNGTNYYGGASNAESRYTRPSKVKFNNIQPAYNSTKITLKWKKASGATGYQIYRATSKDGTYTKVKTITSGSTLSWTNTGLTQGKTYYYKVRAYCKVDGKTVYGSFSDVYKKTKAGWRYVNGYKLYYNASGKLVKDVSGIIGKQSSYVIKVNKQMNCVTVYAKDGDNGYIIPVKAFICSTGNATPIGTFYTPAKYRWLTLMGPCWGQWCTGITGNILFHSVFYNSQNNNMTLSVSAYNKLGTTCSHGCVRLTAGDAKWIYDNCKLKTKVIIYNSSNAGPLGKPTAYKLPSWHTWDPTDPNAKKKCAEKGCH